MIVRMRFWAGLIILVSLVVLAVSFPGDLQRALRQKEKELERRGRPDRNVRRKDDAALVEE